MKQSKIDAIKRSFKNQGLMNTLGCKIAAIELGQVTLELPIRPEIGQQHGVVHAGATFAIGDSASGYAALSMMDDDAEVMTVEMKINLLAPAAGQRLLAVGEVVKAGRRLIITRCTVKAEADDGSLRDVAILQGTMIPA